MSNKAILVVDDNPQNLKLVRVLLQSEGYTVMTAIDAQDVLRALDMFTPAVILMDIQLPDMDGLELTRRLKKDPHRQNIHIIALTAYAMKGDEERARAAGCDAYVSKPIDSEHLLRVLVELAAS